jgi:hypothetical protein
MENNLLAVRNQLKRVRNAATKRANRLEATTGLSLWTLRTAMCIACICQWDMHMAALWVMSTRRRGVHLPAWAELDPVQETLEDFFLASDLQDLTIWVDPDVQIGDRLSVIQTAVRWVAQYRTGQWVLERNQRHGEAVRTELVIQRFNELKASFTEHAVLPDVLPVDENPGKMWGRRWRKQVGGTVGRLRTVDAMTLEEKRTKVCVYCVPCFGTQMWFRSKCRRGPGRDIEATIWP